MNNLKITAKMRLPTTTKEVAAWFEDAVRVGRKLPPAGPRGYVTLWPEFKRLPNERYAEDDKKPFFAPTGAAIDRMIICSRWLEWISEDERHLIWFRAKREPWKDVCAAMGCDRTTAWRRLNAAFSQILEHLEAAQNLPSTLDRELKTLIDQSSFVSAI